MIEAAVSGEARQFGLSHAALNALAVIEGAGEPMLTGEVAASMHVTSGSVTSVLDNLEKKGFVVRSNDPADRRRVLVDITPAAQAVLDELLPRIARNNDLLTAALDEGQLQTVLDALAVVQSGVAALPSEPPEPKPRRRPARLTRPPADS
jgi:DNA-binding MarR family transcriptional regulator